MQPSDEMKNFIQPQGVLPLGQDPCELVAEVFIAIIDPFRTEDIEKLLSQQKITPGERFQQAEDTPNQTVQLRIAGQW